MSRIVVEISQLVKWPGYLTGIPRTMDELSSRFAEQGAMFLGWDPQQKHFYLVDYEHAMARRSEMLQSSAERVSQQRGIMRVAKAVERRSRIGAKAVRALRKAKHKVIPNNQVARHTTPYYPLPGDVIFIAWGEAIDEAYINALKDVHDKGAELVQLVHDMIPIVTPQFAGHTTEALKRYGRKVFPICRLILANSQHTKKDVVHWLQAEKLHVPRMEIVRLGDDFHIKTPKEPRQIVFTNSGLRGNDFILTVGTIESRKNHTLLYYTYKLAKERNIQLPKLVIVGQRGWKTDNIYDFMTEDPEVKDMFVFLHDADDENLSWLYEHCLFSVYVSFYEGWGLPIAESIMRGVPCIASSTSSMPEVADHLAARYISPVSTDECLKAIQELLDSKTLASERKRIAGYRPYPWGNSFEHIHRLLGEIDG